MGGTPCLNVHLDIMWTFGEMERGVETAFKETDMLLIS